MVERFRYTEEVGGSNPSRAYHDPLAKTDAGPFYPSAPPERLVSLDFFRGCVMFLLIGEATGLYDLLLDPRLAGTIVGAVGRALQHQPWNGLRLWDLGLPFFLLISGVALAVSSANRSKDGQGGGLGRILRRSLLLLLLGWALYLVSPVESNPRGAFLYDVLPHLAFGGLVAFLLLRRKPAAQLGVALGLLALTEALYRLCPVPGYNQPFVPDHNFGSWVDRLLTGELSEGHWVAWNIVPSAAFVIWGTMAGRLLLNKTSVARKIRTLVAAGLTALAAGLALSAVTPIIRRISTSSFVLVGGGLGLLALAFACGLVDGLSLRKVPAFFAVVGANPLFIYLFTQSGGAEWFQRLASPFTGAFAGWIGAWPSAVLTSLAVWGGLWFVCFWLYRRKILIRI